MKTFDVLTAVAAPLPLANVDTDKILAGRFLKTITREGLGEKLFHALRYADDGSERPDFVLNREPWRRAGILVALDNFGCGSSREHAPWALADFGICAIIAPSFADIFYNNCFKNGILPVVLPPKEVLRLMGLAEAPDSATFTIDLPSQVIVIGGGKTIPFAMAPERKEALLHGLDEIGNSLRHLAQIEAWEQHSAVVAPPIVADRHLVS